MWGRITAAMRRRGNSLVSVILACIWLAFLAFPIRGLIESEMSPLLGLWSWSALAAFVTIYVLLFWNMGAHGPGHGPIRTYSIGFAVEVLLVLSLIPALGTRTIEIVPFICSIAVFILAIVPAVVVATVCLGTMFVSQSLTGENNFGLVFGIIIIIISGLTTRWFMIQSTREEELAVREAIAEDREAVARDVHDLLGHSLTLMKIKSELAARLIDRDPAAARAELAQISVVASDALSGIRNTVTGLRVTLDEQLIQTRHALRSGGVEISVNGSTSALSPAQSLPLAWILRECTTNTLRHARARAVTLTLEPGRFRYADDGRGSHPTAEPGELSTTGGNGIAGMRERAATAGARFTVESSTSGGFAVGVTW